MPLTMRLWISPRAGARLSGIRQALPPGQGFWEGVIPPLWGAMGLIRLPLWLRLDPEPVETPGDRRTIGVREG